jgi:putative ABC transport system ATP-binding protein
MDQSLFRYIWRHTRRRQMWILLVVLASLPFYFFALELPKRIVNGPIQGEGFPDPAATARFMELRLVVPSWLAREPVTLFAGLELDRVGYLVALSLLFLALVCLNGLFKLYINTAKGRLGEHMLRRLRYELIDRLLRFPIPHFRKIRPAEVATMIKDEVEPLGGFIGEAFIQPVFLAGQALTALAFILAQNVWLGLVAATTVVAQALVIPRLRRRLLELAKQRQLAARELAGRVGELMDGAIDVHTNDTSHYERADVASRLGRLFVIRYELYKRKFFVKFLNNFMAQVTPFLFFLIGGYFAIRGALDIGQLVAVIAAYKDLPQPIKELIDWDQQRQDVQIKYSQVVEQFAPENMLASELQAPHPGPVSRIDSPVEVKGLSLVDDTGHKLVDSADFTVADGERIAVVSEVSGGGEYASEALARLLIPRAGRILLGGRPLDSLPEFVTGRRIGYVGPDTYLRNTSLHECLLYSLFTYPRTSAPPSGPEQTRHRLELAEAEAAGNTALDINADWLDYEAAGVCGPDALLDRLVEILETVELDEDVLELGLKSRLEVASQRRLTERVLVAREALRKRLATPALANLVEHFDPTRYNEQATIAENLLFGAPLDPDFAVENLAQNAHVLRLLSATGLDETLIDMGHKIAKTVVELFGGLAPGHPFFDQLGFIRAENLPAYEATLARVAGDALSSAPAADRIRLLGLAFHYLEPRHRLGLLSADIRGRVVAARVRLHAKLPRELARLLAFYDPGTYNAGADLEDNILFGRVDAHIADGPRRAHQAIRTVLNELHLDRAVLEAGLRFNVGPGGKRLSIAQRQKIGLARALLKRPDLLIVNHGLGALGARRQRAIIERVLELAKGSNTSPGFSVFWVVASAAHVAAFDRVLVLEEGRIVEDGRPELLLRGESRLAKLIGGADGSICTVQSNAAEGRLEYEHR